MTTRNIFMITIKTRADASAVGIRRGTVAAFRLHDGECPVGIVTNLHRDHFTVSLLSFLSGSFTAYLDIGYAEVHSVEKGIYEKDGDHKLYDSDRLGRVQTDWHNEHQQTT